MIGWLSGVVVEAVDPGKIVLNVHGVGYDIETSLTTFFNIEREAGLVSLYIHTIVREDAFLLYGFFDKAERSLFRRLIKVNGVGPKLAISILSAMSPEQFIQFIRSEQVSLLTKIPGVGKKTAERLVVEMKDSLSAFEIQSQTHKENSSFPQAEALSALEALGYTHQSASKILQQIDDGTQNCEQLIRSALKAFAGSS